MDISENNDTENSDTNMGITRIRENISSNSSSSILAQAIVEGVALANEITQEQQRTQENNTDFSAFFAETNNSEPEEPRSPPFIPQITIPIHLRDNWLINNRSLLANMHINSPSNYPIFQQHK